MEVVGRVMHSPGVEGQEVVAHRTGEGLVVLDWDPEKKKLNVHADNFTTYPKIQAELGIQYWYRNQVSQLLWMGDKCIS